MEQWPTQVTCDQPGGMSNLPCEAMAHSHKYPIGAKLVYLPPYSPDFNPIEECFSFMKAWLLRHEREAVNPDVHPWLIHWASLAVTADDVAGWFGNCGYL